MQFPDYSKNPKVTVVNHPLVEHKLSVLRDKNTSTQVFRQIMREITLLEGYEATKFMETREVEIETPLEKMAVNHVNHNTLIVPIVRAGLAFEAGLQQLIPGAKVGHLGMSRDEETKQPIVYLKKMPPDATECNVLIVDPMLATGGSMVEAIRIMRELGCKGELTIMVLIAVPEGIKAVLDFDSNVRIVTCAIDRELNEDAYILPGIGDCGDRIFGTV